MNSTISKETIDSLFCEPYNQYTVLIALYKLITHNWDNIAKLHDYPKINDYTWKYITQKFIEFDGKHYPNVLSGGLWMNSGFSIDNRLSDWQYLEAEKIQYKGDKNPIETIYINYTWSSDNKKGIRISIKRKFTHSNYTVYHFAQFAKLLYSHGFKFTRLESNPRICLFVKG